MMGPATPPGGRLTIEALERWALFGAHWRVLEAAADTVLVELCQCTGEPVERHRVDDAEVIEYLQAHPRDDAA